MKNKKYEIMYDCQYSLFNDMKNDKEYFKNECRKNGWKYIKVKRIKTDTKGLMMYELTGIKYKED